MKKRMLTKTAVFAMTAALTLPATVYAAPATTAPVEMSVTQDGKMHKVFVFGTSLALVSTDGSIEISNMGPVGRVDVMIDGNLTKNVASINIPAGQQTKMVLDEGSIVVRNVSAETSATVKKQISDAYASGASSVDLASLANVAAYKINENGTLTNAAGNTVSAAVTGISVSSVDAASASFTTEIQEIVVKEAETASKVTAPAAPAQEETKVEKKDSKKDEKTSSSSSSSSTSNSGSSTDVSGGNEGSGNEGGGNEGGGNEGGGNEGGGNEGGGNEGGGNEGGGNEGGGNEGGGNEGGGNEGN